MSRSRTPGRRMHGPRVVLFTAAVALLGGGVYAVNAAQVRRNAGAMLAAARTAAAAGNTAEAGGLYLRYLNFQSKDTDALAEYAAFLDRQARTNPRAARDLADTYERLLVADPDRADERRKLVTLFLAARYYVGAKHHLEYLLDPTRGRRPDDPELLEQYAVCELATGRRAEAADRLRQAVATRKAGTDAYIRLAELLRADPDAKAAAEEADRVVDQLVADRPGDPAARVARAKYLFAHDRPADGRAELVAARKVKDAETNPELALLLAEVYVADKNPAAARDLLAGAVAANPDDPRLRLRYADVLGRLNDRAKADEELRAAAKKTPDAHPHGLDLTDWMIDRGDLAVARAEADRRFGGKERFAPVHQYLTGRLHLAAGDWPAALAALQAARPAFANLPAYHAKLLLAVGDCHLLANNPDRAADAYAEAVRRSPQSAEAALKLADAKVRLGRPADALATYRRYADTVPAARAALARGTLTAELAKPAARRDWAAVEKAAGQPPFPAEVEVVRVAALDAQGKADAAADLLRQAVRRFPEDTGLRLATASLVGRTDPIAGLAAIAAAEKTAGDRVAFRLARAGYLARAAAPDLAAVQAVGENAGGFRPGERLALYFGLGELLYAGLGQPIPAATWLRRAADENRFHVPVRLLLVEALLVANPGEDADRVIGELAALEGADGPNGSFARAVRDLARLAPGDRDKAAAVRATLEAVAAQRAAWARPHFLLGQLAERVGDPDAAIEHYRKAIDLGDRGEPLVRSLVGLLIARRQFSEAVRVLEEREKAGGLSAELQRQFALAEAAGGKAADRVAEAVRRAEASNDPRDQLFRGRLLLLGGNPADAAKAFERAVSAAPGVPDAWVDLVTAQMLATDPAAAKATVVRAEAALRPAADALPNKAAVPTAVGRLRATVGDYAAAEQAYRDALQRVPDDAEARRQLAVVYRLAGRPDDADRECEALAAGPAPEAARRWARRTLAFSLLGRPDGFRHLPAALALIEENLKAGDHPEDRRAKGLLLTADPFRRAEARRLIEANRDGSATPEENARIALAYEEEGDLAAAEDLLKEATRGPAADPAHLALLHRVQLARGRAAAAQATLDRLKAADPQGWPTATAAARQLARHGDKAGAAKRLLALPSATDPAVRAGRVGPLLAELGCEAEAEAVFREVAERTNTPNRLAPLAAFLARSGRWAQAVEVIRSMPAAEYAAKLRTRLYRDAIGSKPRAAVPAGERAAWDTAAGEAAAWVEEQSRANPADPLFPAVAGVIADARGRPDDAIRAFEKSLELAPDQPDVRNNLAALLVLHRTGGTERPLELVNRAIEAAGPRPYLLDTRATVHLAAGRPADAVRDLDAALVVVQKPVYYFHLALAHERAGNPRVRAELIDKAVKRGLKKELLHPQEWPDYERLVGPAG